ncbi:hypothetical protein [Micromonospora sp. WMMC250]|uniref:hypothetical protein n=1 Tax=Micromonospora sp. WMMC250 TaxID=3014781 RepID=UPI0022B6D7A6|nr:hypothetical protein [Micromonospora sp. WMMC250]MCZ7374033.1 hypothetical protein [Micromonospora sp. WMMC250]
MTLAAALVARGEAVSRSLGPETYKTLLQFVLVVVLGGAVSLIYQATNRDADLRLLQAQREEERTLVIRETRQQYLRELIEQYHVVKRSRRMLRAHALTRPFGEPDIRVMIGKYDEFMQLILDAQLWLEGFNHLVQADGEVFPTEVGIVRSLKSVEGYVRSLIAEYESLMPTVRDDAEVAISAFPALAEFVGPYAESGSFRELFIHPMQAVLHHMRTLVLKEPSVPIP